MGRIGRIARLVYILAAVFALTVVGTRAASLWREWRSAISRAETGAEETARLVEQYAQRVFETSDLVADQVLSEVALRGGPAAVRDDPRFRQLLRDLAERTAGDRVVLVDAGGFAVAGSAAVASSISVSDRSWFQEHLHGADRVIGGAMVSRFTGQVVFTYSRALRGPDGALAAVVLVAVQPVPFLDGGLDVELPQGAVRGLWTVSGRPLGRTGLRPEELGDDAGPPPAQMAFPDAPAGHFRATAPPDFVNRLYAYRRIAQWGVVAAVGVPVDAALAPFHRDLAWSIGLLAALLGSLGLLVALAAMLDRREQANRLQLADANTRLRESQDALEALIAVRTQALAEANRRLRENEARYRGIFNASFQLVVVLRPDGTMVEANDAALAFAGLTQGEVAGQPLWNARWWDRDGTTELRLRDAVARAAAGEFVRFEAEVGGIGQSRTVIDFSLKPARDNAGATDWLVAEGRDIGALKAAQAQLHEAQKLEVLGQLTGGVAHDFNNLLMAVLGNLNLLRKRLPDVDPRHARLIDGAVQGAERGAALTQRLLAFARRQELRPVAIDLATLIGGMRGLLERSLGPSTRIAVSVPAALPAVRADANQLEMALLNLALNARDAMADGGVVQIEASEAPARGETRPGELGDGRFVRLAVIDDGCGMDSATLARATEPFFTTKGPGRGSGLGLSMVHGLAAQSGGRLAIRSAPERGTAVELWLPVANAAPPASQSSLLPPLAPTSAPLAVLLVEDDPLIQAGTAAMLEDLGHRVVVAASGAAGLEALRGQGFQLVITDYAMPGMSGAEFARRALELRPGLPVILASGFAELPEPAAAPWPRLAKPYAQEALAAAIDGALRAAQGLDDALAAPVR